ILQYIINFLFNINFLLVFVTYGPFYWGVSEYPNYKSLASYQNLPNLYKNKLESKSNENLQEPITIEESLPTLNNEDQSSSIEKNQQPTSSLNQESSSSTLKEASKSSTNTKELEITEISCT